jgi:hypothetical protein
MTSYESDIAKLERIADEIRAIRSRCCEPKANTNRRYLALSNAVSGVEKAAADMRTEM